jgi:hypothetical protein
MKKNLLIVDSSQTSFRDTSNDNHPSSHRFQTMAQFVALAASIAALVLPGQDKKKDSLSTRNISPSVALGPSCIGFLFVGLGEKDPHF